MITRFFLLTFTILLIHTSLSAQWNKIDLSDYEIYSIVKNRYNNGFIMCNSLKKGLVISKDDGLTFTKFKCTFTPNAYHFENDTIYVGGYYNYVAYTTDYGSTFIDITTDSIKNLGVNSIVAYDKNILLAGTLKNGVYQFNKKTKQWKNIGLKGQEIVGIVVKDKSIYANINYHGLAKTSDFGKTWKDKIVTHNNSPEDLIEYKGNLIYATYGAGLRISKDNGESWQSFDDGLPSGPFVGSSFALSKDGNQLFLIGDGEGVFLFNEQINKWQDITKNLPSNRGNEIAITNDYIFVECFPILFDNTSFIFKSKIQDIILSTDDSYSNDFSEKINISPNPVTTELKIELHDFVSKTKPLKTEIFDNNGRLIKVIILDPQESEYKIELSELNSGLYTLKFINSNNIFYKRFVKI